MIPAADIPGLLLISGMIIALILVAETWARVGGASPEASRKLVHLGGGIICLLIPFKLTSAWTVLLMALLLAGLFLIGKKGGFLHCLHRVKRTTSGSEFYPLVIFMVFVLAKDAPWIYVSSILVLALADAFAALVGARFGKLHYMVESETKTIEGSLTFLLIAFCVISLSGWLLSDVPLGTMLLAALLVSVLAMGFEAISLSGADNLFVPIGTCVILAKITTKPFAEVVYQNLSLLALIVGIALLSRLMRAYNAGATIAFILFAYGTWSLGGEIWALPVLLGFLAYYVIRLCTARDAYMRVQDIFRPALIPLLCLIFANTFDLFSFFYGPYILCCACIFSFVAWNYTAPHRWAATVGVIAGVCGTIFLIPWWLQKLPVSTLLIPAGILAVTTLAFHGYITKRHTDIPYHWNSARFLFVVAAAAALMGLQRLERLPTWQPERVKLVQFSSKTLPAEQ
jgi:phytol kinase